MIGKRIGDFEIIEEIGKGGMGKVYKAMQLSLDRYVAIKVLPQDLSEEEEFRERFDVEAKAVASLIDQHIVQMYAKGITEDGIHYFAMEYVEGDTLADQLKGGRVFNENETIDIIGQACQGLEAARLKNIIHRDIKPSNLMITKAGVVKVADFGLAKSLEATKKLTRTNVYMGTVAYTSPEQGEGRPLDHRTDIYSLGIVLYQMLVNRLPFDAETPSSVIYKHVHEPPPAPRSIKPDLSPRIEEVVLKAIAKKPEDRYQTALEFRAALEAVRGMSFESAAAMLDSSKGRPQQGQAAAASAGAQKPVRKSSNTLVVVAVVAIALLLTSALGYGFYRSPLYSYIRQIMGKKESPADIAVTQPQQQAPAAAGNQSGMQPPDAATNSGGADRVESAPETNSSAGSRAETRPGPDSRTQTRPDGRRQASNRVESGPGPREQVAKVVPQDTGGPVERRPQRHGLPLVSVLAMGDDGAADIVESTISGVLTDKSFPLTAVEASAISGRYSRHGVPFNAVRTSAMKAHVLVYASVRSRSIEPLKFYGRSMDQYSATITIKAIDTASNRVIDSPGSKTVNYTSLNMQENIAEAVGEMMAGLPGRISAAGK